MTSKNDFPLYAIHVFCHYVFKRIRNIIFYLILSSGHTNRSSFILSSSRLLTISFNHIKRHIIIRRENQFYSLHVIILVNSIRSRLAVIRQADIGRNFRYSPVSNVDEELLGLNRSHQVGKACSFNLKRQPNNKEIRNTDLQIRIRIQIRLQIVLFLSVAFKTPTKNQLLEGTFTSVFNDKKS
jgi:hypothetical protein